VGTKIASPKSLQIRVYRVNRAGSEKNVSHVGSHGPSTFRFRLFFLIICSIERTLEFQIAAVASTLIHTEWKIHHHCLQANETQRILSIARTAEEQRD
jgi:hypothetical protein